jgi:hypothetical protein
MSKIFALLAILLILTGVIVLAVPKSEPANRSLAPTAAEEQSLMLRARDIAEQLNAPLSILFGLVSLVYSRRSYHLNRARAEAEAAARAARSV